MNRLEQAREFVRQQPLPEPLRRFGEDDLGTYSNKDMRLWYFDGANERALTTEVTPEVLARSLHYRIGLGLSDIPDETAVPLGASKYRGLPHLPVGFEWPAHKYFMAQFNLAQLHPHDIPGAFPETGMLYLFLGSNGDVTVEHYAGPLDALAIRPYPSHDPWSVGGYYLDEFRDQPSLIQFDPGAIFYLGGDAYDLSEVIDLIPARITERVAEILGCPVKSECEDNGIFGRPHYWQGELERLSGDKLDEVAGYLLFEDEFGEGTVHVWISSAGARARDYSGCWTEYSGT